MTYPACPHLSAETQESLAATKDLYARLEPVIPFGAWVDYAPDIQAIRRLKKEKNALVLAHNYMTPEVYFGVADVIGDSLLLAREAAKTKADIIVVAGVHFMAETAKLMNPDRVVLSVDPQAGCSLADAIDVADVHALRAQYPHVPVVTYVNTSVAVKAESDICCTSANAQKIVESLGVARVLMIPDQYLAQNVARRSSVEIIPWRGACEVHEKFTGEMVHAFRASNPNTKILAHPECPAEVVEACDYAGSTGGLSDWIAQHKPARVLVITETSMTENLAIQYPATTFVRLSCASCPYMKKITLKKIRTALERNTTEVKLDPAIATRARRAVQRMIDAS